MSTASDAWVHEIPLGGRRRPFWWRLDDAGAVSILVARRTSADRKQKVVRTFSREELERLLGFMGDGAWHPSAASAPALRSGEPTDGIAPFIRHALGRSACAACFAGQLAVVLTHAGLWEWDGKKRRMHFRQTSDDLGRVAAYFAQRQADPGEPPPSDREAPRRRQRAGPQPPAFDVAVSFRGRTAALQGQFEAIGGGQHRHEQGQRREAILRQFLRAHLPGRFAVGRGEVATPWGEMSRQIDILIYDAWGAAPLLQDAESLIVPIESVYAAIEVKTRLNADTLPQAIEAVRSVKGLRLPAIGSVPAPRPPIFGAVIASHTAGPATLARRLRKDQKAHSPALWLDAICIPGKAVIHRQASFPGPAGWTPDAADEPTALACAEAGEDSLLYFFLLLDSDLKAKTLEPPDLAQYATGIRFPEPKLF